MTARQEEKKEKKSGRYTRPQVLAWAGILALSVLCVVAGREGLAALFAIQARHEAGLLLKIPDATPVPAAATELREKTGEHLRTALALDPGNPFLHEDLALWLDGEASRLKGLSPEQRTAMRSESRDHLRRALALRPVSPYTWASLAVVKSRLGEWDEEMQRALRQAAVLGPWEADVQLKIAAVGWAGWDRWPADLKAVLEANVVRASKRQREVMLKLVENLRQRDRICMNRAMYEALKPEGCSLLVRMLQEP